MRLNPDCVRDILLTIEEFSDGESRMGFPCQDAEKLRKYSNEEVLYHVRQCVQNNLLEGVTKYIDGSIWVRDLSPNGHAFIANIRNDTLWNRIRQKAPTALPAIIDTAISVAGLCIQNPS